MIRKSRETATLPVDSVLAEYIERSSTSFMCFLKGLVIPVGSTRKTLYSTLAPHQEVCFADLAPSLEDLAVGRVPSKRRFWIERTKKASKDTDLATCLIWLLAFAKKPLYLQVGASDRDQANIIRRRIETFCHYNDWLKQRIVIQTYRVKSISTLVTLDILAADIAGSHGETPDLLVCNELSHITKWEFIENLLDNADGVPHGMTIIATNAGFKGSKAAALKAAVEDNPNWTCHYFKEPAPWLTPDDIADARRRNPPSRFARLWKGVWVSGKGDALSEDEITRCFRHDLGPETEPTPGIQYVAGLDLGISKDHAGFVMLGVDTEARKIRVVDIRAWEPDPRTGEVDLIGVRDYCYEKTVQFGVQWLGFDPHQAVLMSQELAKKGVPMQKVGFTPLKLEEMANTLKEVLSRNLLESYWDGGRLQADLGKFSVVEKSYGLKLEAVRDETGHADVGTALVIALPEAVRRLGGFGGWTPKVLMAYDETPLTKEEEQELPEYLKDIYDAYEEKSRRVSMYDDL